MPLELYLGFIAAVAVLIATPGPVVALVVATSLRNGVRRGLAVVAGASTAMGLHLALVCIGLAAMLSALGAAVFWIKWIGAAYLVYLGVRAVLEREPLPAEPDGAGKSMRRAYVEGFAVSAFNPKPLIFYAAFFPLFLSPGREIAPQLFIMCVSFFVIGLTFDSLWAIAAGRMRPLLVRAGRWLNRITGGVLILAAAALAGMRRSA